MKYSLFLFLIFWLVSFTNIHTQERIFSHYGLTEGLPQETVQCLTGDAQNFIWVGTSDGVARFDGTEFFIPPLDETSNLDFAGLRIGTLLANNDMIYAGTGQKGILAYNTKTGEFQQIGFENSNCSTLFKSSFGIIAGYFNKGLGLIDQNHNFQKLQFLEIQPARVNNIVEHNERIYLGTDDGLLYYFHLNDLTQNKPIPLNQIPTNETRINEFKVFNDNLLIATDGGLLVLENQKLIDIKIDYSKTDRSAFNIRDVVIHNQKIFLGTTSGLLEGSASDLPNSIIIDKQFVGNQKNNSASIASSGINDLLLINDVLAIGSLNLNFTNLNLIDAFQNATKKYPIDNPMVFTIYEDEDYMWIGSASGLIIEHKISGQYVINPKIRARSILKNTNNDVWIASSQGIYIYEASNISFLETSPKYYNNFITEDGTKFSQNVRSLYKDRDNDIWLVGLNQGIYKFIQKEGRSTLKFNAVVDKQKLTELPSPFTLNINQDHLGLYWITTQKGLSRMMINNSNQVSIKNYSEKDGLLTNGTLSSHITSKNELWIATRKGISKYNYDTDNFTSYAKRDGLSNSFVYHIQDDYDNNLWLSTNGGLFRFNPESVKFSNYSPKDGLQSTEYNLGAVFKNDKEQILFGGVGGLDKILPEKVNALDQQSPLKFTTFKSGQDAFKKTNSFNEKLNFDYDEFPLDFSFSALDYRPNKSVEYQYRLTPNNESWTYLEDNNHIQFLNLPFGEHTLEIQGLSRGVSWNGEPLKLDLKIVPPWYRSNIAYVSYLLLFLGIVYAFYRVSLQRQIAGQESKRLQDLDDLKSRFITNITHEFRTPLTIILGYLGNLKERFNSENEVTTSLNTIEQNSNNLLNLVNQMLDLAKLEKGQLNINLVQNDIVVFASNITNSFTSVAQDKGVNIEFVARPKEITMDFDPEKIRQILTNLISNAIKFSPKDSRIRIVFETKNDQHLCIQIKDEGYGISEAELPFIFDRFYQVENAEHKVTQGTGVGLALTKELIELFKGRINVSSEVNKGTTFNIELPISNQASLESVEAVEREITIGTVVPQIDDVISDDDANSVLIVEDNSDMARYIASCIKPEYKVTFAKDGKEGFNLATTTIPDIIITDVMMPIMDGFELTKALQGDSNTNHIPIIMLTSKAMQEDRLEGITSGADAYLTKPFQKKELQLRMQMLITKRRQLQERYSVNTVVEKKIEQPKPQDKKLIFLNSVIDAIHQHLDNSKFGATELANYLAMSDSQLYRKLKAITNTSTAVFIRKVRLEKGKELIDTTEMTISEIAYSTGFNDPNWFSKSFKEEFKQSPSSFRN